MTKILRIKKQQFLKTCFSKGSPGPPQKKSNTAGANVKRRGRRYH